MNWQVVAVVALIVVWAVYWKAFVKNFWKILYIALAVAAFFVLMKFAWFCAEKAFSPRTAELQIVASGNVDPAKVVGLDSYKATYELFNSHFSQLLVILGFLGTMFGVLIPAGAYLLQRQSLKDERERMEKDFKAREDRIVKNATAAASEAKAKAEESLRLAEEAKNKFESEVKDNYKILFDIVSGIAVICHGLSLVCNNENDKNVSNTRIILASTISMHLAAKVGDKRLCNMAIDFLNSLNITLHEKIKDQSIEPGEVKIIKDCLGDDFHKFKEVYNKYFKTPLE